jgi:hypothetical protein
MIKHMKSISHFIFVFTLLVIVTACTKDSAKEDLSPKSILTSHGWKLSSISEIGNPVPGYDYTEIKDCQKDDCWIFYQDGSYKRTIGSIKCDPNETDSFGIWSLTDAGSGTIDGSSYYSFVTIEKASLVMQWEYLGWGLQYTYVPC